ncbi:unnamed protein product, partial [Mesorhabditis belari]|uniref:N-acetyltransferase domain-containing protein n=1 Tax=Mesorhabditis belari TaxID=2138241 RepID=A0AAF3FJJ4_9BILA
MTSKTRIELFQTEKIPEYLQFLLSDFCKRQPMNVALKIPVETTSSVFTSLLQKGNESGVSFVLYNENDELIGLLGSFGRSRGEIASDTITKNGFNEETDEEPVFHFSRLLDQKYDIWNRIPKKIDKILWISIISVRNDYSRKGLAKLLINHGLEKAKEVGYEVTASNAGALESQKLFESLGFVILCEGFHTEFLDKNGHQLLKCLDETKSNQLVFRYL